MFSLRAKPPLKTQHPLIRAGITLVVLAVAIGGIAFLTAALSRHKAPQPNSTARAAVPVQTMVIQPQEIDLTRTGLGTVTAWKTAVITPQVSGPLVALPFHEGAVVQEGEILAQIDPRPFQAVLDKAKAKKAQDEASLTSLADNLNRDQTLLTRSGFATQKTVDTERAQVAAQKAAIAGDAAAIETAQLDLDHATVKAPFTSVVGLRNVDVGNLVTTSSNIVTITEVEPIAVDFTLPQADLILIQAEPGKPVVRAFDQSGTTLLAQGDLDAVNNEVDPASGTIKLKARFDNKDHKLWPGLFVQVRVVTKTEPAALALPSQAVQRGPNGLYVWLANGDETVRARPVQIEAIQGDITIVASGLSAGDRVVVAGQYRLADGTHVTEADTPRIGQSTSAAQ
jgi:multidrug efflux system membrane fusion protein